MIKLIKELFRSAISEAIEYNDNDVIDFNEINLNREYDKLNDLLFNGKCQDVTLLWGTRKTAHGHVRAYRNRLTGKITIDSLTISKFYHITYKLFKDTLAHEMIHIYLLQQNINDNHGMIFQREMNRINGMNLGFNITISNTGKLDVSSAMKGRNVVIAVFSLNGKNNIAVMTPKTYNEQGGQIANIYQSVIRGGKFKEVLMEFYESNNNALLRFTIQRSFNKGFSYRILTDDDTLDKLLEGSRKISEFYTNGNEVIWNGKKPSHMD